MERTVGRGFGPEIPSWAKLVEYLSTLECIRTTSTTQYTSNLTSGVDLVLEPKGPVNDQSVEDGRSATPLHLSSISKPLQVGTPLLPGILGTDAAGRLQARRWEHSSP